MAVVPKRVRAVERFHSLTAAAGGGDTPQARNEHPRVWVTSDNLATIQAGIATGGVYTTQFQQMVNGADDIWYTVDLPSQGINNVSRIAALYGLITATWLGNATTTAGTHQGITYDHTKAEYAARGVAAYVEMLTESINDGLYTDSLVFIMALDMLWPHLTAQQREDGRVWINGAPPSNTEHPFNALSAVTWSLEVLSGMIFENSEVLGQPAGTNTWATTRFVGSGFTGYDGRYDSQRGLMRGEQDMNYPGGGWSESEGYLYAYAWPYLYGVPEAVRRYRGISKATFYDDDYRFLRDLPGLMLTSTMPTAEAAGGYPDGKKWKAWLKHYVSQITSGGNNNIGSESFFGYFQRLAAQVLTGIDSTAAGLAQWHTEHRSLIPDASAGILKWTAEFWPVLILTRGAALPTALSPTTAALPLNRERKGAYTDFRTDWTSTTATYAFTESGQWQHAVFEQENHPGHYGIFRNGPALIYARGGSGRDCMQLPHSGQVVVAVDNTVTTVPSGTYAEGGLKNQSAGTVTGSDTFYEADGVTPKAGDTFKRRSARTTRLGTMSGRKVHYQFIDHSLSYLSSAVTSAVRRLVYFEPVTTGPAVMIVFDRMVTTDTKHEKRVIVNLAGDPAASGGSSAPGPSRGGTTWGKTTFTDPDYFSATVSSAANDFGNISYLTFLYPPAMNVVRVGGGSEPRTAQAGGTNTITLNTAEDVTAAGLQGRYIEITAGPGAGQIKKVSTYVAATKVATVDSNWSTQPTSASSYSYWFVNKQDSTNPSRESEGLHGDLGELFNTRNYYVFHYPDSLDYELPWMGRYRLEGIPDTPATTDHLLHAVEVGPTGMTRSTTTLLAGASNCIGTTIGAGGAIFPTGASSTFPYSFRIETTGTFEIFICGLTASTSYTVSIGSNFTSVEGLDPVVGSSSTSIAVTATAEGTAHVKFIVGTGGTGAANTVSVALT